MDDDTSDTSDDAALLACLRAAAAVVNGLCGYTAPTPVTEVVTASDGGTDRLCLSYRPVISVTSITPQTLWAPAVDITGVLVDPVTGVVSQLAGTRFYGQVLVSYVAGRSTVPESLQQACLLIARNLWELRRGGGTNVPNLAVDDIMLDPNLGLALSPRARELMYHELLGPGV